MARIIRTPLAKDDVAKIWRFIAIGKQSPEAAEYVLHTLNAAVELLSENPLIGESAEKYGAGLRMYSKWNYVLFYKPLSDGIELVRLIHGARSFENLF